MGYRLVHATALAGLILAPGSSVAGDLPQIRQSGVIRAVLAADEQVGRFNTKGSGEPRFERELLERFAGLHGVKVEPVVVPRYVDRIPALQDGKADVIVAIHETAERREVIEFSVEVMPARQMAVSLRPHRVLRTPAELREEKVGLLRGTTTWLKDTVDAGVPASEIAQYPSLDAVFAALKSGEITATVMSVADVGLARHTHPDLQPGPTLGTPGSSCWGVRKTDGQLLKALNDYLSSVRKTPTWSRLVVKYYGEETLMVLGKQ